MSESLPFVDVLADTLWHASQCRGQWSQGDCRAALHALIAHYRADRTGKPDLPVAAPASASASARAEAMRRLREAVAAAPEGHVLGPVWGNLTEAARALLALPEPDECAGLRELEAFALLCIEGEKRCGDEDEWVRGLLQGYRVMLDEIRRLIAERGGK